MFRDAWYRSGQVAELLAFRVRVQPGRQQVRARDPEHRVEPEGEEHEKEEGRPEGRAGQRQQGRGDRLKDEAGALADDAGDGRVRLGVRQLLDARLVPDEPEDDKAGEEAVTSKVFKGKF